MSQKVTFRARMESRLSSANSREAGGIHLHSLRGSVAKETELVAQMSVMLSWMTCKNWMGLQPRMQQK